MTRTLRIGSRGSALALVQANWTAARLADHGIATEISIIRTEGDDRQLDTAWGEGAFVGRIVAALLDGSVDVAVHSAKDVPTDEHPGLWIAAYPKREDARDALVCRERGTTLATLHTGARVGTDSPRRIAFLRAIRPDLDLHPLHGNVDTRLAKLDRGDTDALVLAVAGLTRLGLVDRIDDILPPQLVAWAPGQGALALQVRADDAEAIDAVGQLDDAATRVAVEGERAVLGGTGGGCRSPIGVTGRVQGDSLELVAGAERAWTPAPGAAVRPVRVGWIRGTGPSADRLDLARRLAGRVVTMRTRPRALVTRPAGQAGPLLAALAARGIDTAHVPAIAIEPVPSGGPLDEAVLALRNGDLVVVTSVNAATSILDALARKGVTPGSLRWAAIGATTAAVVREGLGDEIGFTDVFTPSAADGATLAAELPLEPSARVLVPHGDLADPGFMAALGDRGAEVTEAVAYHTVEAPPTSRNLLAATLDDGPVDALVLTSGSTARGLLGLASEAAGPALLATPVIAAGSRAAEAASDAGFSQVLVAPAPEADALAVFTARTLGVRDPGTDPGTDPAPEFDPAPTTGGSR